MNEPCDACQTELKCASIDGRSEPVTREPQSDELVVEGTELPSLLTEEEGYPEPGSRHVLVLLSPDCNYCRESVRAWNRVAASGATVVGISVRDPLGFVESTQPDFPIMRVEAQVFRDLGARIVPQTLVVEGRTVLTNHVGLLEEPESIIRQVAR